MSVKTKVNSQKKATPIKKVSIPSEVRKYLAGMFFRQWNCPDEKLKIKIVGFLDCLLLLKLYPGKLCNDLFNACDSKFEVFDVEEVEKILIRWERQWDSGNATFGKVKVKNSNEIDRHGSYSFWTVIQSMIGTLVCKTHWYRSAWCESEPTQSEMFRTDGNGRTLTLEDVLANDWKPYVPATFDSYVLQTGDLDNEN